ncbi:MAG: hypothetical protein MUE45_03920 [Methanoregulaceae archaeon]|jgi:predicted PurR-regulated permease PerM|nr:hypothetical protein [Methanoregulaceae archaeon]
MVFKNTRNDLFTLIVIFLILLMVFVVYFPLASPIILGMTLAVVVYPLHRWVCQRMTEATSGRSSSPSSSPHTDSSSD